MTGKTLHRSSFQIMKDTVFALFIRELRTRFGGNRLGYFWAIAEPAGQAAVFAILFSIIGRESISGVPVPVFMITGMLTFKLFTKLLTQSANAVISNKGLMTYRQVEPIDPVLTRSIIEVTTYFVVLAILMGLMGWFLSYDIFPDDLLEFLLAITSLASLSLAIGMILCSVLEFWPDANRFLTVIMTPLLFISGVFYSASMLPQQYWPYLSWNPIFHGLELMREGYFSEYRSDFADPVYLIELNLVFWALALSLFKLNRPRFISG